MTNPSSRSGRSAAPTPIATLPYTAPHAALLIDFDNVTLGIRSDLTKELKTLLNSDIIRGKVTVQRAYADWRRYTQYVMPLTERSIDLIYATAVGSTKKNATDIRLAIDAMELVFTRPEIGTFILLSGDSDFSSLVMKLKEYGKLVIGVGIRESASDLLIQNCDEYYSYSELAGLSKETESSSAERDPWELVKEAVAQMSRNGDVMRSDRLKQVMQQLDSNFDERNAGFNRFSKFVTEAGTKGLIRLTKLENGQFEVGPVDSTAVADEPAAREREDVRRDRSRRGGRGRGRERDRSERPERAERAERPDRAARPERAEAKAQPEAPPAAPRLTLAAAFQLMTRALGELGSNVADEPLRSRMAALYGREDPLLEPGRFSRLLRQANDAEIADVRKVGDDSYEVSARAGSKSGGSHRHAPRETRPAEPVGSGSSQVGTTAEQPVAAAPENGQARSSAALRYRRGSRSTLRLSEVPLVGMVRIDAEPTPEEAVEVPQKPAKKEPRRPRAPKPTAKTPGPAKAEADAAASPAAAPKRRAKSRGKAS
ncbi:MAG: NYN domain-containing protein [Gemmatimonadota bacterium]